MNKITGIDISKETFDASFFSNHVWHHKVFKNSLAGFKALIKWSSNSHFVMESSGPYYVQLATYLHQQGFTISVVNPLIIRRYSQMKFYRAKTDKKDAKTIAEYGMQIKLRLWKPSFKYILRMQQLISSIELLHKQLGAITKQMQAFRATGSVDEIVHSSQRSIILKLNALIKKQETALYEIAQTEYSQTMDLLKTIPGIGNKTAAMLIVITNNFEKFKNHRQLIAYVGFSPRIFQSGTSVNGKGHICKMGKSQVRKLLYLCTWSAKRHNSACVEMYERLKEKGKPERVIKIALANKLIKQAFAVVSHQTPYEKNYHNRLAS